MKDKNNFKRLMIFSITAAACLMVLTLFPIASASSDAWWDTNWQYRKEIIVDYSMVDVDFTDFQFLINTVDIDLMNDAQDDGDDIVFTDDNGIKLEHEIESFNGTSGELVAWVNVPSLSSAVDTVLYMYYGNPSCTSQQNIEAVWDSSFVMVQHLNEGGEEEDATVHDLGFGPHSLQGDDNYLYIGSISSSDGVGVRILLKSDFSVYKHLDPSGSGTFVERISVSGDLVAFTQGNKGHVYDMSSDTYIIQVNAITTLRAAYIDGEHVYFGETTGKIYRVNITTLVQDFFTLGTENIREIDGHEDRLIVASNNDNVYLINRISLATIHTFTDSTANAEVSQIDEDYIWYGSDNQKIWIRDADSPYTLLTTLTEPSNDITAVFHDGNSWFASCDDGNVYAWNASSGFSLIKVIDKSVGGSAERLWLDTVNNHLYFIIDSDQELWRMSYPLSPLEFGAIDSTSNNNDGTYLGSPTTGIPGKFDGAIDFDGTNDCINLGNDASIEPGFLTIEAWIKPDDTNQDRYIIQGIGVNKITERSYVTPGGYRNLAGTSDIQIDEWTYVTLTYDGSELKIYVNGGFESSFAAPGILRQSGGSLFIGAESGGATPSSGTYFNGIIDEVRISNIARSDDWIEAQYNCMNGGYITFGSEQLMVDFAAAHNLDTDEYFITIQGAIDDADPCNTIEVLPGIHVEQLLIDKDLSIIGQPGAILQAPAIMNAYMVAESSSIYYPIIFAYGGTFVGTMPPVASGPGQISVEVTGLEIDGANLAYGAPDRFVAILYRNIIPGTHDSLISNNVIHNMYDADGMGNGPQTFGILIYGDSLVTVLDNTISDFSRGGIGAIGDN